MEAIHQEDGLSQIKFRRETLVQTLELNPSSWRTQLIGHQLVYLNYWIVRHRREASTVP